MSSDIAIKVENLSKCYQIYEQPRDRLKQFILPHLQRALGQEPNHYYQEFWALKDISFEVKKGETIGIIGRNGSGKSTLLQILCGTLNPTSGSFTTNGRIAALLELGSGFNPEFTGRENVYMNAAVLGLRTEEVDQRFNDISTFADIGQFIEQPVKTYSSGMMVRLAFAVIAHVDADILVIDEALAVGDAFFTQKCMRFLRKFMETGSVLFVSHDTSAVLNLCNRAILLSLGEVIQINTPQKVIEKYLVDFYESFQKTETNIRSDQNFSEDENVIDLHDRETFQTFDKESILSNDIEVIPFQSTNDSFGTGYAKVISVKLFVKNRNSINLINGKEQVTLEINCLTTKDIFSPIIGFQFKDRLGQVLFCDNTYLTYQLNPITALAGQSLSAYFNFKFPQLPAGDYTISPAIAEGTQLNHVQHHWIHDALLVKVNTTNHVMGLVGLDMSEISIQLNNNFELVMS